MSTPKINPNYYAIIPASVRYDNALPSTAKLLYGEIASLSNQEGFCWASNSYFGKLYELSPKRVSELVSALESRGHIKTELDGSNSTRYIYLAVTPPKNTDTPPEKCNAPLPKNVIHNNKTNNKNNNSAENDDSTKSKTDEIKKIYQLYLRKFKVTTDINQEKAARRYKLTPRRSEAVRRRLDDAGLKMLAAAIVGYSMTPWYTGDNDRGWTADLELFICRSYENVEKGANFYEASKQSKQTNDPWA